MNSIIERCKALQERIERWERLQALQQEAATLGERQKELAENHALLQGAVDPALVLVVHRHLDPKVVPDLASLLPLLGAVKKKLREQPQQLASGRDYRRLRDGLATQAGVLRTQVESTWRDVVQQADRVDEAFLAAVAEVPGQRPAVDGIRELRRRLIALRGDPPSTEEGYSRFESISGLLSKAVDALDPKEFPADVLAFFKAASSPTGAPLGLLTQGVLDWLRMRAMEDQVRVRTSGGR